MKALLIGKFQKPFGIKGYLKTEFFIDSMEELEYFPDFFIRDRQSPDGWKKFEFLDIVDQGERIICKVDICPDRNAADAFHNVEIFVDEEALPESEGDEFYIKDLLDCEVFFKGASLGRVSNVLDIANRDILLIRQPDGKDLALPFEDRRLETVDTAGKQIIFKDIEDLL